MKGVYTDELPLNARVHVDYVNNDVKFQYPYKMGKFKYSLCYILPPILDLFIFIGFVSLGTVVLFEILYGFTGLFYSIIEVFLCLTFSSIVSACFTIPVSFIIGFNYKKYMRVFPKFAFKVEKLFRPVYKVEKTELETNEFVIPAFGNVFLGFEASGDFSDNLEGIDIVEYPFDAFVRGKKRELDSLWQATFRFSDIPKSGKLSVEFM